MVDISESIKALKTAVPSCPILDGISIQHHKTLEMLKIIRFRRKKAVQSYELYMSFRGKYHDAMLAEFRDFLISIKTTLDSLAHELCLVFSLRVPERRISFNLHNFVNALEARNKQFADNIRAFCENGNWFQYFLDLRNSQTHRGLLEGRHYARINVTRDTGIRAVYEKFGLKKEILDVPDERQLSIPHRQEEEKKRDRAIQEVRFLLPDNPKEVDSKKLVYEKRIFFGKYITELSSNIDSLFIICYKEAIKELNLLRKGISEGARCV